MKKNVLVVDDDPVVRILIGESLSSKGYEVTAVSGGEECFAAIAQRQPDVLILDFYMPGMSGMEILLKLRSDPALAKMPILMLSADSESEKILKENNAYPNAFLRKPVGLDEVVQAIVDISDVQS